MSHTHSWFWRTEGGLIAADSSAYPGGRWRLVSIPAGWPPVSAHSCHGRCKAMVMRGTGGETRQDPTSSHSAKQTQSALKALQVAFFTTATPALLPTSSQFTPTKPHRKTHNNHPKLFHLSNVKRKAKRSTLWTSQRGTRHLLLLSLETSANHSPLSTSQLWFHSHQEAQVRWRQREEGGGHMPPSARAQQAISSPPAERSL